MFRQYMLIQGYIMKAKVVYIEHEKAERINEILIAEKEFLADKKNSNSKVENVSKKDLIF